MITPIVEAWKIATASTTTTAGAAASSLLFDPISHSLALTHSSSISIFSPFSLSSHSLSSPQTLIPSPFPSSSSSSTFLSLSPNPNPTSLFIIASSPSDAGPSSRVLLRFYLLKDGGFGIAKVRCGGQRGVNWEEKSGGVVVDVRGGEGNVGVTGSVNYFAVWSSREVRVFGVRMMMMMEVEDGGVELRLVKCAVIECGKSVRAVSMEEGWLVLGETGGVRVWPLRKIVKGKVGGRRKKGSGMGMSKVNVESCEIDENVVAGGLKGNGGDEDDVSRDGNVIVEEASDVRLGGDVGAKPGCVKLRSLKLRQDSEELGMCFMPFLSNVVEGSGSAKSECSTTEAISIQALSRNKFLVLDSIGNLHILHVPECGLAQMRKLTGICHVRQAVVVPDSSSRCQTVWISNGPYSVQTFMLSEDESMNESENNDDVKPVEVSVARAIFVCEGIQDMVLLEANSILILGQDSLYAYSIS